MPLVSVRNLSTWFPVFGGVFRRRTGEIKAVDDVSFDIEPGQTVGLVGESGSGKTTIGRTLLKLPPATSGQALYEGRDILSTLDVPVLCIAGALDATAPAAVMEKMAAKIAGAEFVALEGLGHFGWAEAPGRFNAALLGFLGRRGLLG